jgi:1-acyl-sn-glycerol-3-phosphate acyltransferase
MAVESGVPILPITVTGIFALMPPGSLAIRSGTVDIYFHEPVPTTGLELQDRKQLMQQVWDRINSALEPDPVVIDS